MHGEFIMSDMPDFDSMTPEELMKWMESLAVRQGATEGLTTSADMEVAEVAADDERLAGKGDYVPYGWTEEKWKEHLAKEEEDKKAKGKAAPAPQPQAAAAPPPPPPAPEPEPVAQPAAAAGGTPDFDSMTPEELMKWMESLAVRQGATEGLTTSADMAVEEVAADDERLAGKGDYVPYGWTEDKWKEHLAKEEEQKKAKGQAAPAAPVPAPVQPEPEPEAEEEFDFDFEAAEEIGEIDFDFEAEESEELDFDFAAEEEEGISFEVSDFGDSEETGAMEPLAENPMDWLSSLGAPDESLPNLQLDLDVLGDLAVSEESGADPMAWLSGLSNDSNTDALASLSALAEEAEPANLDWMNSFTSDEPAEAEEGSLEWMESLAARQGADSEELVTDAKLNIPSPFDLQETGPGYAEFSFENATGVLPEAEKVPASEVPDLNLDDPSAWLDSLASGGNVIGGEEEDNFLFEDYDEEDEEQGEAEPSHNFEAIAEDVKSKLDKGMASPEEIELFFRHAFTKAGERTDVEDYIDSGDAPEEADIAMPVQAEIPDWLRDSMETIEPVEEEVITAPRPSDTGEMMAAKLFDEEEAAPAELPDWLSTGMNEDTGVIDADIFAAAEEESAATPAFALDTQDTWVEAFTQEESGELAEWYENAVAGLEGGEVPAVVGAVAALATADLPDEDSLQAGTPIAVPSWLSGEVTVGESVEVAATMVNDMDWLTTDEAEAIEAEMPDWLMDTVDDSITADEALPDWLQGEDLDIAPADIPDWLRETVEEEEVDVIPEPVQLKPTPPAPTPTPPAPKPVAAPVPVKASPAPVPVAVANIDVAATLQDAQNKLSSGDVAAALLGYEQVINANASLPQVETVLQKLADDKNHKGNPAVHRVLGDALMRQGKLQQALDTYRKALNLL
jgi:hypothetical protein